MSAARKSLAAAEIMPRVAEGLAQGRSRARQRRADVLTSRRSDASAGLHAALIMTEYVRDRSNQVFSNWLSRQRRISRRFGTRSALDHRCAGRVNLIGEHTDYNDGFVLPMAIERYVVLAAGQRPRRRRRTSRRLFASAA